MKTKSCSFSCLVVLIFLAGCNKPNDYSNNYNIEVIKDWNLLLQQASENHVTPGLTDSVPLLFFINSDKSIRFDMFKEHFSGTGDKFTGIQINLGDPVTDGPVIMNFSGSRFSPDGITGIFTNLRQSLIDTLLNDNIDKYINVLSTKAPSGLLRAQLNHKIIFAANIPLTGVQVVPPVNTSSTGTALLRVTADSLFYSKVIVNDTDSDPSFSAGIYDGLRATPGRNLLWSLASAITDFNLNRKWTLSGADFNKLLNNTSFVQVNSPLHPNGKLRGQIR